MKLKYKLTLGFASLTFLVIITNIVALMLLSGINQNITVISENTLPGIKALLSNRINQLAVNDIEKELMAKMLPDSMRNKAHKRLKNAINREFSTDSTYATLPKSAEEAEVYTAFRQSWIDYMASHDKFMALEATFQKSPDETNYLNMCNYNLNYNQKVYDKVTKLLNQLIKINTQRNDETRQMAKNSQYSAYWILSGSIILGLLLAIGVGWYISREVARDLGEDPAVVAGITEQIAAGKLNLQLQNANQNTGILGSIEKMSIKLKAVVIRINDGAQSTSNAGRELSSTSEQMARLSSEQAAALEEVSSSMEEMVAK